MAHETGFYNKIERINTQGFKQISFQNVNFDESDDPSEPIYSKQNTNV